MFKRLLFIPFAIAWGFLVIFPSLLITLLLVLPRWTIIGESPLDYNPIPDWAAEAFGLVDWFLKRG